MLLLSISARFFTISLLLGLFFSSLPVWAMMEKKPHWQNKHYIEYSFYDIALRGEHQVVQPVIKKWRKPLKVWAFSTAGDARSQYALLNSHLKKLTEITRLPIQSANQPQQANVRVFFTTERAATHVISREISPAAVQYLQSSICLGHIRYNRNGEITRATIVIPVQRAQAQGKLASCVVEELTQMLGLINDSHQVYPTVFNDATQHEKLTGLDYIMLKLLYSPEIKTGMTLKQAAPLIRQRLHYWEHTGLISQADFLIQTMPQLAVR